MLAWELASVEESVDAAVLASEDAIVDASVDAAVDAGVLASVDAIVDASVVEAVVVSYLGNKK